MTKAMDLNIRGIKCDSCDYKNMDIEVGEYEAWLNEPCPKCGENLLTKEDLDSMKELIKIINLMNMASPVPSEEDEEVRVKVDMNGTGDINFKVCNDD